MSELISPEKALIFRITHRDNLPWIVKNGLHPRNSSHRDPHFVSIGNIDLIEKRQDRTVPISPGGTLSDYVPFYFTPYSPMLLNIKTGYHGVVRRSNDEIVVLVSSLHTLVAKGIPFVFTDRHAYLFLAQYYSDLVQLDKIDWNSLRMRDFRRDPDDPGRIERYQAEALVYQHVPLEALVGIACHSEAARTELERNIGTIDQLPVKVRSDWYF
jgi:hypothetical protein